MAGKIQYTVSEDDQKAFLSEFGGSMTERQRAALEPGSREIFARINPAKLPDANNVDPNRDPETARKIIMNPRSIFDIGESPFVLPILSYLNAAKQEIPPEIKVISEQADILLLKYGISAEPRGNEKFTEVDLCIDYPDDQNYLTYSMTPDTLLEEKVSVSNKTTVGLDVNLQFKVSEVPLGQYGKIGGGLELVDKAGILFNWEYKYLVAKIVATGMNCSFAKWNIKQPQKMIGNFGLTTVLCIPKGTKEVPIEVKGYYSLERGIAWWKQNTKMVIKSKAPIKVKVPVGITA